MHYCAFLFPSCALMPDWWVKHWFLTKNPIIKYQKIQQKIIYNLEFNKKLNKKLVHSCTLYVSLRGPAGQTGFRAISAEYSKVSR